MDIGKFILITLNGMFFRSMMSVQTSLVIGPIYNYGRLLTWIFNFIVV